MKDLYSHQMLGDPIARAEVLEVSEVQNLHWNIGQLHFEVTEQPLPSFQRPLLL